MKVRLLSVLLFACLAASAWAAPEPVGLIISLQGTATATGTDNVPRPLRLKSPVFANDLIVTAAASKLQIMFEDDSVVALGERSRMTIDAYVYDPAKKDEGSCTLKLIKGLFRVVTGAITEGNPERFKAHTRLATVGIRGCELGFRLHDDQEEIYILQLPKDKRIVIGKTLTAGELEYERRRHLERVLTIARAGLVVQVREGMALEKRAIGVEEARHFIRGAAFEPAPRDGQPPGGKDKGGAPGGSGRSARDARDRVNGAVAEHDETARRVDEDDVRERGISTGPEEGPGTAVPQEPPPDIVVTEPRLVLVGGTPFDDWEWAIWEDGKTEYYANRVTGAAFLAGDEYRAIANGATRYHLTGRGTAGALVKHAGVGRTLDGTCTLNVHVGQGTTADWDGVFDMNNSGGDTLAFGVSGGIDNDGMLNGLLDESLVPYELQVDGRAFGFGTVTSQDVEGRLIHPPLNPNRVSAAAGRVRVHHGGAASVHSAFGATLNPVP